MSRIPEGYAHGRIRDPEATESAEGMGCPLRVVPREAGTAFDTLENKFFSEGEELSTAPTAGDGWDETTVLCARRHRKNRRVLWVTLSAVAALACGVLVSWRIHSHRQPAKPLASAAPVIPAPAAPAPTLATSTLPVPSPALTTPEPGLPDNSAPAAPPFPSPPEEAAGAALVQNEQTAYDACKTAYDKRRGREVLAHCARAFEDNPNSAVIATMLAKVEFDRGRSRQAIDWAKKAVALDADHADAYVFLGGAEQAIGHAAAAKTAYQRYLQLSPKGRYAAELRAVLGTL